MLSSKLLFPYALHLLLVGVAVFTALIITRNPVALLGLLLMPSMPMVGADAENEGDEGDMIPKIGFHAEID